MLRQICLISALGLFAGHIMEINMHHHYFDASLVWLVLIFVFIALLGDKKK